jgi:hypothetical protein
MPNSAARLMDGTVGVGIVLVRGGGGREVSGPRLGRLARSLVRVGRCSGEAFDGRRNLSGLDEGAEGVRAGGSVLSAARGKVSDRLGMLGRSRSASS